MSKWDFLYFNLCLLPLVHSQIDIDRSLDLSSLFPPSGTHIDKIPPVLSFCRPNSPSSINLSLCSRCSTPFTVFTALCWSSISILRLFHGKPRTRNMSLQCWAENDHFLWPPCKTQTRNCSKGALLIPPEPVLYQDCQVLFSKAASGQPPACPSAWINYWSSLLLIKSGPVSLYVFMRFWWDPSKWQHIHLWTGLKKP